MPQEPWPTVKGAEPDRLIQVNCRELGTHASYIKQPKLGRTSTAEEQKWSYFKMNDD